MPWMDYITRAGQSGIFSRPETEGIIKPLRNCRGNILRYHDDNTDDGGDTVICIQFRNRLCWAKIYQLSANFLYRYINQIDEHMRRSFVAIAVPIPPDEKYKSLVHQLYKQLTREQKQDYLNGGEWKNTPMEKFICGRAKGCGGCCNLINESNRCIHINCPGCCDDCKDNIIGFTENGVLVCHACQKKQVKKCPICLEDKSPAELCVLGCHHSFCWRCYGMGCMSGEQIVKCPECRAEIIEVKEIMA